MASRHNHQVAIRYADLLQRALVAKTQLPSGILLPGEPPSTCAAARVRSLSQRTSAARGTAGLAHRRINNKRPAAATASSTRLSLQRPRNDQCSRLMGRASRPREQTTYRVGHAIDRLSLSHVAVRGRPEKASSVARGDALAGWRCSLAAASICSSQLVPPEPPSTLPSRPARNHR